jgi:L-ribulose-5-phosphate 3-epimerase
VKKYTVMNNIGFMQGRLVDKVKNNIQFFPDKSWIQELHIAEKENFKLMEWTINYENIKKNPFFTGNKKLLKKILDFKRIKIKTVTCDFFMQRPFFKKKYSKKKILT